MNQVKVLGASCGDSKLERSKKQGGDQQVVHHEGTHHQVPNSSEGATRMQHAGAAPRSPQSIAA